MKCFYSQIGIVAVVAGMVLCSNPALGDLVHQWKLNDTTGTVAADSVGGALNGTLQHATGTTDGWIVSDPVHGNVLQSSVGVATSGNAFAGTEVQMASAGITTSSYTLTAWIKGSGSTWNTNTVAPGEDSDIYAQYQPYPSQRDIWAVNSSGNLKMFDGGGIGATYRVDNAEPQSVVFRVVFGTQRQPDSHCTSTVLSTALTAPARLTRRPVIPRGLVAPLLPPIIPIPSTAYWPTSGSTTRR